MIPHQEIVDTILEKLHYKSQKNQTPAEDLLYHLEECIAKITVPLTFGERVVNEFKNAVQYEEKPEEKNKGVIFVKINPSAEYVYRDLYDG